MKQEFKSTLETNLNILMGNAYKYISGKPGRTIVIGDIHGCYDEFIKLLDKIGFSDQDLLITVGDMVDRGPKSLEVARFFRDTPNAFAVLGNHERRLSGAMKGTIQPAWSQLHTMMHIPENDYNQWIAYFDSLPAVIETPDVIVTHARLDPALPLANQNPYHTCAVGGKNVVIETDKNGIPLWYHKWVEKTKALKPVCFGHLTFPKVELVSRSLFALDSGVANGGGLNAVIFPKGNLVQIISGVNHYSSSYNQWMQTQYDHIEPENLKISQYLFIMEKESLHHSEERLVKRFEAYLNSLEIQTKIGRLKEIISQVFGNLPPSGPMRGDYFINLRDKLAGVNQRMLSMVMVDKPFNMDVLLKQFQGSNLKELLSELETLKALIIAQNNSE